MIGLPRKQWIVLAEAKLKDRKEHLGKEANTCEGCREILLCSGIVSFDVCNELDKMMADGLIAGPKKIPFRRMRQKYLPVSEDYLQFMGFKIQNNKLVAIEEE